MSEEIDPFATGAPAPPLPAAEVRAVETVPDFARREYALREWMDGPTTYAAYCAAERSLERVNRVTRGYQATIDFLARVLAARGVGHEPLHVVDVGCGHGDGLRTIYRWAAKRSVPLRLTGVDINPYAARLARECDRAEHVSAGTITWVTADVFGVALEQEPDVVISSLFAHHLADAQIVDYLRWCERTGRVGWFVSDLRRSARAAKGFKWLSRVIGADAMVQHDGVVSFRRALSLAEWRVMCAEANVDATVRDVGVGRLCVERMKS